MTDLKIRAFHLLTDLEAGREINSISSVSPIGKIPNVQYTQIVNIPYTDPPPKETCTYPDRIGMTPVKGNPGLIFTPGSYGCYLAHRNLIESITPTEDEIYLIFESDARLLVPLKTFIGGVYWASHLMRESNIDFFTLAQFFFHRKTNWTEKSTHIESDFITGTHCYILLGGGISKLTQLFKKETWQTYDFWLSEQCGLKFGAFRKNLCGTFEGESLIDRNF